MQILSEQQALEILNSDRQDALYREAAARYLEQHPQEHLVGRLVRALQDDDEGVRWAATHALTDLSDAALPELLRALKDPARVGDPRLREGAYHVLHHWLGISKPAAPLLHELRSFLAGDIGTMIEADRLLKQLEQHSATQLIDPGSDMATERVDGDQNLSPRPVDSHFCVPASADVYCQDGIAGRSEAVVVRPDTLQVSYIILAEMEAPRLSRLVPLSLVEPSAAHQIRLRCDRRNLTDLKLLKTSGDITTDYETIRAEDIILWPYFVAAAAGASDKFALDPGERILGPDTAVRATDGPAGRFEAFGIGLPSGRITDLVVVVGHWWQHRRIAVPSTYIDAIRQGEIYLKLSRTELTALPVIPVNGSPR